jgi:hypothetical protein
MSWYNDPPLFSGDPTLGLRNITEPTLIGTEHAMHLFYIGNNRRIFRTSMAIDDFPSDFGTSSIEIETIGFDFGENIIWACRSIRCRTAIVRCS